MGGSVAVAVHQLQCLQICHQPIATKAGGEEAEAAAFDSWDLAHFNVVNVVIPKNALNALMDLLQRGGPESGNLSLWQGLRRGLRIGHDGPVSFYFHLFGDKVFGSFLGQSAW